MIWVIVSLSNTASIITLALPTSDNNNKLLLIIIMIVDDKEKQKNE